MNGLLEFLGLWRGEAHGLEPQPRVQPSHEPQPSEDRLKASVDSVRHSVEGGLEQVLERVAVLDREQSERVSALQSAVEALGWHLEASWVRELLPLLHSLRAAEVTRPTWRHRLARRLTGGAPDVGPIRRQLERILEQRGFSDADGPTTLHGRVIGAPER